MCFRGCEGPTEGQPRSESGLTGAFLDEAWESIYIDVKEITEAGDARVFLETLLTARGAASGVETELRAWQILWITDGKVVGRQVFFDRTDALEAAGLEE